MLEDSVNSNKNKPPLSPDLESVSRSNSKVDKERLLVVVIGASAGGLEACRELITGLPTGNLCYVFCQHISSTHESLLKTILTRETKLSVLESDSDLKLEAGIFYVPKRGFDIQIEGDRLALTPRQTGNSKKPCPNIDIALNSLAKHVGSNGIAVILSGSGSDGAKGIAAVKESGGLVLVQSPNSCSYDSMPRAAIATQRTDLISEPKELSLALDRISRNQAFADTSSGDDMYQNILNLVALQTKIDFSSYRKASLQRRLLRRMNMLNIRDLDDYHAYLVNNQEETALFVQSCFVVVSEFYRDLDAFNALKKTLHDKFAKLDERECVRIWVAGCATGEEVYTLAMMLEDLAQRLDTVIPYKFLATDLSHDALAIARKGEYERDKLANIPSEWLEKYFKEGQENYQVKKCIRERVIFSYHDILSDPPFSNMHLVSCRNLLIYFDNEAQKRILSTFLYSVLPDGLLFLGEAESCNEKSMFIPLDEKHRIYQRNRQAKCSPRLNYAKRLDHSTDLKKVRRIDEQHAKLYKALVSEFVPTIIVVNEDNHIVYKKGDFTHLLSRDGGFVDPGLFGELKPELRAKVRALMFKARQSKTITENVVEVEGGLSLDISIRPVGNDFEHWFILHFSLAKRIEDDKHLALSLQEKNNDKNLLGELDQELMETRESLQVVIEELESTNEQLQIYNEELQSSNEEYQSTNEELQTVNEELQSANEELLTVNEEYSTQSQLFQRLTNDLTNIQESIEIPLILISLDFRIKRYTSSCNKIFDTKNIQDNDLIYALEWFCEAQFVKPLIDLVERQKQPCTGEVVIKGRHFECRVSLYINDDKAIDGYILVFYETTQFKVAQYELERSKAIALKTVETIMEGVIRIDGDLCVEYANPMSCSITGWSEKQMKGMPISRVLRVFIDGEDFNIDKALQESIDQQAIFKTKDEPLLLKTRRGRDVYIDVSFSPTKGTHRDHVNVIAFRDVSQRHEHVKTLIWTSTHDALTGLINRKEIEQRVDQAILTAKRNKVNSTFMFLDLDQFKVVNDTCGHQAGDLMLQQLAQMMMGMLRSRDTLARLGGDEFGLLLDKCPLFESESIAVKLQKAINDYRFIYEEKTFRVGASIGIVEITPDTDQVSELLKYADAACFLAKETGRNRIEIHTTANDALIEKRNQMSSLSDINDAIENDGFRLYFQEIQSLDMQEQNHWEVLIRMFKQEGEFLLPNAFLPAAERFGLIKQIDMWLLKDLFTKLSTLGNGKNKATLPLLNINISGATIGDEAYLSRLKQMLAESAYNPNRVCVELTETAAISQFVKAKAFIEKIREVGCRFALDDFGRGMSSLSYLRDLPLDVVKIDSSFVKNIAADDVDNVIIKSVVAVSELLDMEVIAEGVEEQAQLDSLKALHVNQVQGYLFSKPIPFEEFASKAFASATT